MGIRDRYSTAGWEPTLQQFIQNFSRYSGQEDTLDPALHMPWFLALYLHTVGGPAGQAARLSSSLTRQWDSINYAALVLPDAADNAMVVGRGERGTLRLTVPWRPSPQPESRPKNLYLPDLSECL